MIIQTDKALFVPDEDRSTDNATEFYTEVNLSTLIIREDRSLRPPEFTLYKEYKENRRIFRDRLFASSKLEKIINYVNNYLK